MSTDILGIDIGKSKFDAALLIRGEVLCKEFTNDAKGFRECKSWFKRFSKNPHICLEATGIYGVSLASFMVENKYDVSVVNPVQIKRFAESELLRNKTDKSDSQVIARYCLTMRPKTWRPLPDHLVELKQFVTYLESLMIMKSQEENRLENVKKPVAKAIKQHIKQIDINIMKVKKEIDKVIAQDDVLSEKKKLLETIPGIGYETSIRVLAYIGNVESFASAKQLSAFAGLNPKQYQSGTSVNKKTKLSKTGDPKIRKALYMPALVAMRHNPILKEFYERLRNNGKCEMVAIGAVMRKLIHIIYGVLRTKTPFNKNQALA